MLWFTEQVYLYMTFASKFSEHLLLMLKYLQTYLVVYAGVIFTSCFLKTDLIRFKNLNEQFTELKKLEK